MFKSIGKQVVILKNPESKIFEEAIFIVKDGIYKPQRDLLEECERIINEQGHLLKNKNKNKKSAVIAALISIVVFISIIFIAYFKLV